MGFDVGMIVTGKVTGIKKFGAFITLDQGVSGLVHISEIANTYVDDVSEHLTRGQEVQVKIIGVDDSGRINLSIKKAQAPEPEPEKPPAAPRPPRQQNPASVSKRAPQQENSAAKPPNSFEDKLKQFMQESNTKMSGLEMYAGKKTSRRKQKG